MNLCMLPPKKPSRAESAAFKVEVLCSQDLHWEVNITNFSVRIFHARGSRVEDVLLPS